MEKGKRELVVMDDLYYILKTSDRIKSTDEIEDEEIEKEDCEQC